MQRFYQTVSLLAAVVVIGFVSMFGELQAKAWTSSAQRGPAQIATPTPQPRPTPPAPQPTPLPPAQLRHQVYLPRVSVGQISPPQEQITVVNRRLQQALPPLVAQKTKAFTLTSVVFDGKSVRLDFQGDEALLREEMLYGSLFDELRVKVHDVFNTNNLSNIIHFEYDVLINGRPISMPKPPVFPNARLASENAPRIALNPGHGRIDEDNWTYWGAESQWPGVDLWEDVVNLELAAELNAKLVQAGAFTLPVRELNKNYGNHESGHPWWEMGAREFTRREHAPAEVWDFTEDPTGPVRKKELNARPRYANWRAADVMVSIHNDAWSCGTKVLYSNQQDYKYTDQSRDLAMKVHQKIVQRLREQWDSTWNWFPCNRGVEGAPDKGENNFFDGPAILIELASVHRQSDELQNSTFRSIAMNAVYEALVEYYGSVGTPKPLDSSQRYRITAQHSGQALDVSGGSANDGAPIIQWPWHGGSNQLWTFEPDADGFHRIRSLNSGKCLDVAGDSKDDGAGIIQYSCHGGDNQRWQIISESDGSYIIRAKHSGKVFDVAGGSRNYGASVIQWTLHEGANQRWLIEPVVEAPQPPAASLSGNFYNNNPSIRRGGVTAMSLTVYPTGVSGSINFSNRPEDTDALCGAGSFSGSRDGSNFTATFVSNDTDAGCGFDRNARFILNGTIEQDGKHVWGTYGVVNADGSSVVESAGVFEVWAASARPGRAPYRGTFTNTGAGYGGPVSIDIALGTNTVSGYVNFTNDPGHPPACGAGEFVGTRESDVINASFVSHDPDPGCGFDWGLHLYLTNATLSGDRQVIEGGYGVSNGQTGTFRVVRAQ